MTRKPRRPAKPGSAALATEVSRPSRAGDFAVRIALKIAYRLDVAWSFVIRPRAEGVYVALWHQGRLLAVRNSYRRALTLPSGRRGRNEDPRSAAIRELAEEVGVTLAPEALRPAGEFTLPHGYKRDHVHFFSLEVAEPPPIRIDRREVIWAGFMTPEEMRQDELSPVVGHYLAVRKEEKGNHRGTETQSPAETGL